MTPLCKGAFASLYGALATCTFKSFDEAFASLLDLESLCKRAFAPLHDDVSVDGAFASLIDSLVAMQGSVRSLVWRRIIRLSVRSVD